VLNIIKMYGLLVHTWWNMWRWFYEINGNDSSFVCDRNVIV